MNKPKEFKAISIPREYLDAIESRIIILLRTEIYGPLVLELKQKKTILKNSYDDLINAITSGQIQYVGSHFEGSFNSSVSKELKLLGAEWDRSHGWWSIPRSKLTYDMSAAIGASTSKFKKMAESIDKRLERISPKEIAEKLKVEHLFDKTLYQVNKDFESNVKNLMVAPKFTADDQKRIAAEYTENMQLYIKDFLDDEIKKLRTQIVGVNAVHGFRYESMIKTIKDSYGVSQNKARFLARQETNLLVTKFAQTRYEDAGVKKYKWKAVSGSPAHPVRPMHKALDGTIHTWDNPPTVNKKGEKKNPGQDFGCRCRAIPIVEF